MGAIRERLFGMVMMMIVAVGCSTEQEDVPRVELSPEAKVREMERERMEPYENLRTILTGSHTERMRMRQLWGG